MTVVKVEMWVVGEEEVMLDVGNDVVISRGAVILEANTPELNFKG